MPVPPDGSIQRYSDRPAETVAHDGLQLKFPFHVQRKSYPYFDTSARRSKLIDYSADESIDGLSVYHFHQVVDPVDTGGKLTLPGTYWGIDTPDQVTMHRFYTGERDLWVEPVTGAIVKGQQHVRQYYARTANDPAAVTIFDITPRFDDRTISEQVAQAKSFKRLIQWGTEYHRSFSARSGLLR